MFSFESKWYFCNITKSGCFWKLLSRKKLLINHFPKSLQKQACADVPQNRFFRNFPIFTGTVLESLFNKVTGLLQHMCFLVNIAKFFDSKSPVASVDLLFLIKSNVGWFLLKRVDLVIVRVIYTLLVETISTRFYWLTCRNQKLV